VHSITQQRRRSRSADGKILQNFCPLVFLATELHRLGCPYTVALRRVSSVTAPEASLPPGSRSAVFIGIVFIDFSERKSWKMPSEAHAGKVRTGVLAGIAVEQHVGIVHSTHLASPLPWRTLVHATKATGNNTGRRVRILADVANVTSQLGSESGHFSEEQSPQAIHHTLD
jgi:hypothetical protein